MSAKDKSRARADTVKADAANIPGPERAKENISNAVSSGRGTDM